MAIAFGAVGAGNGGTTSLSPACPAGVNADDMLLLVVVNKYPSNGPSTPTGWTLLGQATGGQGSSGADSGNVYTTVYYRIADGTESSTTVTVTVTSANSASAAIILYTKANNKSWVTPVMTTGSSNTAGTAYSATAAADLAWTTGDMAVLMSGVNSDVATYSGEAITATGATFGAHTERREFYTNQGDDCGLFISSGLVSSGTSSAPAVYVATANTSTTNGPAGATVFVQLREAAANRVPVYGATGSGGSFSGTTSVNPNYPAGISAGDILFLYIAGKYPPNTPTTPAGWTLLGNISTAAGAAAADNGPCWCYVYYKIATGSETGAIGAVTVTSGNTCVSGVSRYTPTSTTNLIYLSAATAIQDAEATSLSFAFGSDPGFITNDLAVLFMGQNSDLGVTYTVTGVTGSGSTFEGWNLQDSASTTNGDDCAYRLLDTVIQTGSSSGAPTITMTTTTSMSVAAVLVRVREVPASVGAAADGVATASGVGVAVFSGVGSSAGTSTDTAVGASTVAGVGASAGVATCTAVGSTTDAAVGSSTGTCTVAGVGASTAAGVGASVGTSTDTAVGTAVVLSVGASDGSSVVLGRSESVEVVVEGLVTRTWLPRVRRAIPPRQRSRSRTTRQ